MNGLIEQYIGLDWLQDVPFPIDKTSRCVMTWGLVRSSKNRPVPALTVDALAQGSIEASANSQAHEGPRWSASHRSAYETVA